ncbi:hypothetical protein [Streptomyces thermodiastaticus]|uniref:hypothetical protein n=1 Tax=Streptomyces thermodiastaticus TaxID=44061 RepID=UPI001679C695|nr:hypothetical protein [Streptomyces thermodiastaticus]MCE7552772.1 hypothetical protein [Streptomyces thermodiastaticus]GHF89021.1 hypothetical protein GCM10018787_42130 [Streptomyces thermodiastaticus]
MRNNRIRRVAVALLGLLILLVLSGAFVASWPSLMAAANGVHLSGLGQVGYSVVPDASAALSVVSLLVLRGDVKARRLAFANLALMTGASVVLNLAHGLGWWGAPETWLLAVASVVPVVSILISTDLLVRAFVILAPALEVDEPEVQPTVEVPAVEVAEPLVMTREEFEEHNARISEEIEEELKSPLLDAAAPRSGRGYLL